MKLIATIETDNNTLVLLHDNDYYKLVGYDTNYHSDLKQFNKSYDIWHLVLDLEKLKYQDVIIHDNDFMDYIAHEITLMDNYDDIVSIGAHFGVNDKVFMYCNNQLEKIGALHG